MATFSRKDLRDAVLARLEDNSLLYPDAEIHDAIHEALRTVNVLTGFYQGTVTLEKFTVVHRHFYEVPRSVLIPLSVYIDNVPLYKAILSSSSLVDSQWMQRQASVDRPPMYWIPIGLRKFAIAPADSRGGRLIAVTGVLETPELINDASVIVLSDENAQMVEDLAFNVLPLKVGGAEFLAAAPVYLGFLSAAKRAKRWLTFKAPRFWIDAEVSR